MFKKAENSINILKACWRVLMLDKELLVFPILSLLALGTVLASIALPIFAGGDIEGTFAAITSDPEYFEN
ncbi:MAG: hypothetical protein JKY99_05280, partial [Rhizobiales bacterium]|nr:hypothetical protein [Hyphomicrobiales bacterium]